ncbi:MAG TPA: toxin-antitoxin system HicB family antitoxin [Thermoanaerobaculia bacterium]|nr:toxin-antitoxin system HicB family antitoxin [Thermoanaerobaculia bacterium]
MPDRERAEPSGRFVLRIDKALHATLRSAAAAAGLSLNEYSARKLALPGENVTGPAPEAVRNAARVAGAALTGVAAFGSWARGELTESSDVDLLIVIDESRPIERGLYRAWDRTPLSWEGHSVEPHFVHPPQPGAPLSSVWAEVAVGGIVLFERDLLLSRQLVGIRERIASGQIVRRSIHGQPYWVEAA